MKQIREQQRLANLDTTMDPNAVTYDGNLDENLDGNLDGNLLNIPAKGQTAGI